MVAVDSHQTEKMINYICPKCIRDLQTADSGNAREVFLEETLTANGLVKEFHCSGHKHNYPVVKGVPLLYDTDVSCDDVRSSFYENHYQERSRLNDLNSSYLAHERKTLLNFTRINHLDGPSLDLGCGTGLFADCAPGYIGLDYSFSALCADGFEQYSRVAASAEAIPFPSNSMQLVISFNVLEHVPRVDLAFQEIDRVLQPGGWVFLKPAWNTSTIQTKLLTERPYSELDLPDKLHKMLVPLLRSKAYKVLERIPCRLYWFIKHKFRNTKTPINLRFRSITPWMKPMESHVADSDACSQIDVFAAIQFFTSRGYEIQSHPTFFGKVCAGHDILIARKPAESPSQ